MLLNPFTTPTAQFRVEYTRMLGEGFPPNAYLGSVVQDPREPGRDWTLFCFYEPVKSRALGGVRARLFDQKGFITFSNQRDLELMLQLAKPGDWCAWAGRAYPSFRSDDFYGLTMDDDDVQDDLHYQEMMLRQEYFNHGYIMNMCSNTISTTRRLHFDKNRDVEQVDVYLPTNDYDPITGVVPDFDVRNIKQRWRRVERSELLWQRL